MVDKTMPSGIPSAALPEPDEPAGSAAQIYAEQVRHLYRLSRSGYLGTTIGVSIMTFALWGFVSSVMLAGWFIAALGVTLGRYLLYRAYMSAPAANLAAQSWADRFMVGAAAMGSMWGILGTLLFPVDSIPHQFLVIFVIGGMAMSAAVVLAPVKHVFYAFVFPALLPLIVVLGMQGDPLHILMGMLAVVFTVVILALSTATKEDVLASTRIKFENAALIARFSAVNQQVQHSNEQLKAEVESQARIQEELRQATRKFQALINASPLAIVVRDANGRIERWNPAAERMFGWGESEVLGGMVPWYPAGKEEEGDRFRNMILRGETFSDVEALRLRKDGTPLTVSVSGAPVHDDRGNAIGIMAIIADITLRRRFELRQELQTAITRLLAESRTVDEALVKVIETMCEKQGWACGTRWVLDKRDNVLRCAEAWGVDTPTVQEFVAETRAQLNPWTGNVAGVVRRVWDSAAPVWVTDVQEDAKFRRGPRRAKRACAPRSDFQCSLLAIFTASWSFSRPNYGRRTMG